MLGPCGDVMTRSFLKVPASRMDCSASPTTWPSASAPEVLALLHRPAVPEPPLRVGCVCCCCCANADAYDQHAERARRPGATTAWAPRDRCRSRTGVVSAMALKQRSELLALQQLEHKTGRMLWCGKPVSVFFSECQVALFDMPALPSLGTPLCRIYMGRCHTARTCQWATACHLLKKAGHRTPTLVSPAYTTCLC